MGIKMKRSSVAGKAPTTTDLELGELAINTTDGKVYIKKSVGGVESIVELSTVLGSAVVSTTATFSGTGSQTAFTLPLAPASTDLVFVTISGVVQQKSKYTISGSTMTFGTAPPSGSSNVEVVIAAISGVSQNVVSNSITTAAIQNGAVNTSKLGGDITAAGKALLDDADAAAQRATLAAAGTGVSNTFSASQVIEVTDNTNAALRITQLGTGNALVVEDSTNPDSTPFIVDASGNVGIGTASPTVPLSVDTRGNYNLFYSTTAVDAGLSLAANGRVQGTSDFILVQQSGGNGYVWNRANSAVLFGTNNTERMRIDANGKVGIGAVSNGGRLYVSDSTASNQLYLTGSNQNSIQFLTASGTGGFIAGRSLSSDNGNDFFIFDAAAGANRVSINSSGNVGIGISNPIVKLDVAGDVNTGGIIKSGTGVSTGDCAVEIGGSRTGSGSAYVDFVSTSGADYSARIYRNSGANGTFDFFNSGTGRIFVQANTGGVQLTNGSTAWASASDERLKTDLINIEDALAKVSSLRSVTGRYKTDEEGVSRSFLIAQDVKSVFPEAVSEDNDDDKTLSLRYTEIIPLLTAALKEANQKIAALEARIAALEAA